MGGDRLIDRTIGFWPSMLPGLGIDATYLTGKHTACPICRDGKDRFRFDDKEGRGTFICSQCGAGNGIDLVMRARNWDFAEAARQIEQTVGSASFTAPKPPVPESEKRQAMTRLWRGSKPVQLDDAVGRYLAARVGLRTFPSCLRTCERALYQADGVKAWHPAMIAKLTAPDGSPATLHRTFLALDGHKADVPAPRRMMLGQIPKGSAVRLFEHQGVLGITEGIENAFAAASLFGVPCWAATNSTLLSQWAAPDDVGQVIVFGDNDTKFGGAAAAYALAHRLAVRDRKVSVQIPPSTGADWNDVLNERQSGMQAGMAGMAGVSGREPVGGLQR